ncbi:MAG: periplasmic heavy metal sensor [Nitrospirae bacterium]|nr:periplasmic heavy metal sensor [Nitrospirota bacterium]
MSNKTLIVTVIGLMILPLALYAQPPGAGGFHGPEEGHFPGGERRLEAAADYLELTDGQRVEWEGILDSHRETVRQEWQDRADLRQQFRDLAEAENPDLTELGSLALTMHRRTEAMRSGRSDLNDQLASILTPDQVEKFEALKAARDTVHPRGKRGRPHHGARPDSGGVGN